MGCWWDYPGHGCDCCAKTAGPERCNNPNVSENYRYDERKINKRRREVMEGLRRASEGGRGRRERKAKIK